MNYEEFHRKLMQDNLKLKLCSDGRRLTGIYGLWPFHHQGKSPPPNSKSELYQTPSTFAQQERTILTSEKFDLKKCDHLKSVVCFDITKITERK